jgi:hypothetical protein
MHSWKYGHPVVVYILSALFPWFVWVGLLEELEWNWNDLAFAGLVPRDTP